MSAGAGNRDKRRAALCSFHFHQWFFLSCTHICFYPSSSLFFFDSSNLTIQPCGSGPWFRLMWSSGVHEFGNLFQVHIWLETLLIWTDSKKDLSFSDLPFWRCNYSAGRWSFPAITGQTLKSPPETTSHDMEFPYESRWLKAPANGAGWAIKISTWTPPTGSTLPAVGMAMPWHNLHPTDSKQSCTQLEPTHGRKPDVVL